MTTASLTTSLPVHEIPPERHVHTRAVLMRGETGGQRFEVLTNPEALYLVRPGAPTRFVLLEELLAAMAFAAPAPAENGGGR